MGGGITVEETQCPFCKSDIDLEALVCPEDGERLREVLRKLAE